MAALPPPPPPPSPLLQSMLQTAVQSVQWTYSLFWQFCPQQGILVWGDGYYNGAIKTRKTVQPTEVSAEEASLQRSQQLRELYDSLSAGDAGSQQQQPPPPRRPSAALSPEDLTESEWFYLMCVSFSFPPGTGLPGKAYSKRQHVWLTGANEVDSKVFSRAILAKSARIQTVVCIPLLDGVVELGTTDKVKEDHGFVRRVRSFFTGHAAADPPLPPKPALSEHSTSNPASSSAAAFFQPSTYADAVAHTDPEEEEEEEEGGHDEDADEDDAGAESDSEAGTTGNGQNNPDFAAAVAEPSELMQLEMPEDIRMGSPDDGSNNLDSDFHLLAVTQAGHPAADLRRRAESSRRWPKLPDPMGSAAVLLHPPPLVGGGLNPLEELTQEDTHYSQTVAAILHHQSSRWPSDDDPAAGISSIHSSQSVFIRWAPLSDHHPLAPVIADEASQWLLKYILFSVPFLHAKSRAAAGDQASPKSRRSGGGGTPQDELSANHVLAERRRREKLNERFIILRSLVPFVTKMDKASILGDAIEYVKQLRRKIQDLEARARQIDLERRSLSRSRDPDPQRSGSSASVVDRTGRAGSGTDKRKLRAVEGSGGKPKVVGSPPPPEAVSVEVSIIESDALLELQCGYREGLLLDIMQLLRELRVETTSVQSSLNNGVFAAELRAKVKENANGKRVSIVEVKRAINQIIPHES